MAVISKEDAINYNLVGPNLRGSGVKYDIRRDIPYSVYPELEFEVPVGTAKWARSATASTVTWCACARCRRAARSSASASKMMPEGPVIAKVPRKFKPPAGECYVRVEARAATWAGTCVSDGSEYPYRVQIRTGSFTAMSIIDKLSKGLMIADLIAVIASLDIVAPEIDR